MENKTNVGNSVQRGLVSLADVTSGDSDWFVHAAVMCRTIAGTFYTLGVPVFRFLFNGNVHFQWIYNSVCFPVTDSVIFISLMSSLAPKSGP